MALNWLWFSRIQIPPFTASPRSGQPAGFLCKPCPIRCSSSLSPCPEAGETSKVLETGYGFYISRMVEREPVNVKAINLVAEVPSVVRALMADESVIANGRSATLIFEACEDCSQPSGASS